ncbi:MAG TPA: ABC transporter ATP-binding protein [Alcanivoracaceae bacterium]|nr:ABC transporter ATP-binding protein [Alcanivoracaceae bacterium]
MPNTILSADKVTKTVFLGTEKITLLPAMSFTLKKGESLAIIGRSGSGKSTLLGILAGLDTPSTGNVMLAGHALEQLNEDERAAVRAAHVGFVFQSFQLLNNLTALENVMLPLELKNHAQPRKQAIELLERVGLAHRLTHYPTQLSGGEQQRVAIARAFAAEPDILFADEPTGNLDTHTGTAITELLFKLNQEQGTTLVLVTHDHSLAQRCQHQLSLEAE